MDTKTTGPFVDRVAVGLCHMCGARLFPFEPEYCSDCQTLLRVVAREKAARDNG